ncbi:YpdA family putative bacillithiol disulfide reductase [Brevibacillus migulae]|uniref:YpdA family putative bacillithiol disulfide reductase n=1 Tax=Brevibacillus migulae TaxID=1644114 RepID=UPI00106E57D6|nr:YpdA family putative bacillithiol disulfide reductase [Brevibacillus migulae]
MEKVVIIGAGPCGLSAAVELKKMGIDPLIIEKGPLVHSIYKYPTYMIFHSTPELLEIGEVPFTTPNEKPTRLEALHYYRMVANRHELRVHSYETVTTVERLAAGFRIRSIDRFQEEHTYESERIVVATGYFDQPNRLRIPGEDLPKVSSFYQEAHPYSGMKVAIIGGNNSAVDAALDLERAGAEVTVVIRGAEISSRVKAWTRPIFESMMNKGRIRVLFSSVVTEIHERFIRVQTPDDVIDFENDFVLSLIGYRPDRTLLNTFGVTTDPETEVPHYDPETMETVVPHVYIAGVIAAGNRHANSIFIENGRHHGKLIANHIAREVQEGSGE